MDQCVPACPSCRAQKHLYGDFQHGDSVQLTCDHCHHQFTVDFSTCRHCAAKIMSRVGRWVETVGTVDVQGVMSHNDMCPAASPTGMQFAHQPVDGPPRVYQRRVSEQAWADAQAGAASMLQRLLKMPD